MNKEIYSAGILPFYKKNDSIYFLLGKDNDNRWSDFGGKVEAKDKFDKDITAAREFWEESMGAIYDYDIIKKIIKYRKCPYIISKTISGHPYYMYLLKLDYSDNYRIRFISTKNFINKLNIDRKYTEKNDIRWISIENIENSKGFITLRSIFNTTFNEYKNDIINIINNY